ncbi:unnamed protein product [Polarella glacialis]|nr:unnamed protein product [Polarella glacialis]
MQADFEYELASGDRGQGEVLGKVLDGILVQMRRGQVASVTHPLKDLFPSGSPQVLQYGPEAIAICEVKLMEIYVTKDCSFTKNAGEVVKEVVKDGIGAWCDNPTDEGMAVLRIEEVRTEEGVRIFPDPDGSSLELCVAVGDGQVCDALECAMLEMRQHETAMVTCLDPSFCIGGQPLGNKANLPGKGKLTLRVTMLDYNKGPDAMSFEEDDRLTFALRRKAEATRLFGEGRFRLARERYRKIIELFHHVDRPKMKDRFLGQPELFQECRKLRIDCRLNLALCSLKLQDPEPAREACDEVLKQVPENTKALYRRAQAHILQQDYVQACHDLQRVVDIDPSIDDARRLLEKTAKLRSQCDRKQRGQLKFEKMVSRISDDRSDKHNDYL